MRLICPNCDAQYEVDATLIPDSGRDVQCADCGHVWFQVPQSATLPDAEEAEQAIDTAALLGRQPAEDQRHAADPQPEPRPAPVADAGPEPDDEPDPQALRRHQMDESLLAVLREEAEREIRARAEETARAASRGLETQPDLGLDAAPALRIRPRDPAPPAGGLRPDTGPADDAATAPAPALSATPRPARRELLPDIDQINSTLDASGATRKGGAPIGLPDTPERRRSGFRRGFVSVLVVAILAWGLYAQAERLTASLPQIAPLIEGYVATVDGARIGLDRLVRDLLQTLNG
jgi:predicted Zn finger-like uncharacterized protein